MSEISEARLASLPKWARNEIKRLQANERYLSAKLATGPEDSNTFADPFSDSDTPRPLGADTMIEFVLGNGRVRARVAGRDRTIVGYLDISADERIVIEPRAANAVRLRITR